MVTTYRRSLVYGWPTETDPLLLDNDGLSNLNLVKIQSKHLGKLKCAIGQASH